MAAHRQQDYSRILDGHNARGQNFSHTDCENILIDSGFTHDQAKNGAYVYLHHGLNLVVKKRGTRDEYNKILDNFMTRDRTPKEAIERLEDLGYSYGQSKSAVYRYRKMKGLI